MNCTVVYLPFTVKQFLMCGKFHSCHHRNEKKNLMLFVVRVQNSTLKTNRTYFIRIKRVGNKTNVRYCNRSVGNKIGDLSQLINIIIRCRHQIRHAAVYFYIFRPHRIGWQHLNTKIKTNTKRKHSKNGATEIKPHAKNSKWV